MNMNKFKILLKQCFSEFFLIFCGLVLVFFPGAAVSLGVKIVAGVLVLWGAVSIVNSLKEKRMVVKSLVEKTRHKFNASVAEVDLQDEHKMIVIGFACVSNEKRHANSQIQHILDFMEKNTEAELISAEYDVF